MCSTNAYHLMSVQFGMETFHVMSVVIHVQFHVYTMDESVGVFVRGSKGRCQSVSVGFQEVSLKEALQVMAHQRVPHAAMALGT